MNTQKFNDFKSRFEALGYEFKKIDENFSKVERLNHPLAIKNFFSGDFIREMAENNFNLFSIALWDDFSAGDKENKIVLLFTEEH